jgi:type II secretory pathway component PulM
MKFSLDTMSEREQRLVKLGGIAAVLIIIFGVLLPLDSSVTKARARITQKQADLVWMRGVAPVLATMSPAHQAGGTGESLLVVIDRSVHEAGIDKSVKGTDPNGTGSIQVRLEKASFDAIIGWISRLSQQNGLTVDGATIDNTDTPGIVNAAIMLRQQ